MVSGKYLPATRRSLTTINARCRYRRRRWRSRIIATCNNVLSLPPPPVSRTYCPPDRPPLTGCERAAGRGKTTSMLRAVVRTAVSVWRGGHTVTPWRDARAPTESSARERASDRIGRGGGGREDKETLGSKTISLRTPPPPPRRPSLTQITIISTVRGVVFTPVCVRARRSARAPNKRAYRTV